MGKEKIKTWWSEEEINKMELFFLHKMFECSTQEGVDVAYSYAKFLSKQGLTPDNYPLFLKLFSTGNHWVIDVLLGENDPLKFFDVVQPNSFIVSFCFEMLKSKKKGEIYPKLFLIILGILNKVYNDPGSGYRLYPLTIEDLNNLGKHLNKNLGQKDDVNKAILHFMDRIAELAGNPPRGDKKVEELSIHANNIRGKFLDETKSLSEVIPEELLKEGDYKKNEIKPTIVG